MTEPGLVAALSPVLLQEAHAEPLVIALNDRYYVPEARLRDAIARRGSFNLIHLETMVKIDVFRRALEESGRE